MTLVQFINILNLVDVDTSLFLLQNRFLTLVLPNLNRSG